MGGGGEREQSASLGEDRQQVGWEGRRSPQAPSLSALGRDSEKLNIIAERACLAPENPKWNMHVHQRLTQEGACTRSFPLRPPGARLGVRRSLLAP